MRDCIECGVPTEGSIGAAGLKWNSVCQPCKDKADADLAKSLAATAAAYDYVMPKVSQALRMATHDHGQPSLNAGCDKCGIHDREPDSLWCSGCNEEWNRLQAEPSPATPEAT